MAPKRADRDSKNFGHGSNTDGTPQAEAAERRKSYNAALRAEGRILRPSKPGLAPKRVGMIQRQQRLRPPSPFARRTLLMDCTGKEHSRNCGSPDEGR